VADRDPEEIRKDIDQARDRLAATVDTLADRANPTRLAEDLKTRVLTFVTKPAVAASLAGLGLVTVVIVIRRARNR
jgi:membrane-bound ClpP family serine protease